MKWVHIDDCMRRLRFSTTSNRDMVRLLRHGIDIRIAKNARIHTFISENEAQMLLQRKSIKKLEVLARAAASSADWVCEHSLPILPTQAEEIAEAQRAAKYWGGGGHGLNAWLPHSLPTAFLDLNRAPPTPSVSEEKDE